MAACYGKTLAPNYKEKINIFRQAYKKLKISITPKVRGWIRTKRRLINCNLRMLVYYLFDIIQWPLLVILWNERSNFVDKFYVYLWNIRILEGKTKKHFLIYQNNENTKKQNMRTHAHAYMHGTHIHMHARVHTCACTRTHAHAHAHMHTHTHRHAHTCARTRMHTHTHTYARTHTPALWVFCFLFLFPFWFWLHVFLVIISSFWLS